LATDLQKYLEQKGKSLKIVHQDHFFNRDHINRELGGNWDLPGALDHWKLRQSFFQAINHSVADVIILEGFMAYFDPCVASACHLRFWISLDVETAATRRECRPRGRMPKDMYYSYVWPNHVTYTNHVDQYTKSLPGWSSPINLDGRLDMSPYLEAYLDSIL
jgi:uridine kinase